ncbi:MAG: hypothetical protein NTV34_01890, partial [Proteobacteria bacterium]|nr:hypothetical protein [Pseudomonadota bacterium]
LKESEGLFAKNTLSNSIATIGEFFPFSVSGSLKVSILENPIHVLESHATHFVFSRQDFERSSFPGIVYGQFTGQASKTVEKFDFKLKEPHGTYFIKPKIQNTLCTRALFLQEIAKNFYLLGCGYCPP